MPLAAKRVLSFVSLPLFCLFSAPGADATVFRDRAAFEAAAQNLRTLDFESVTRFEYWRGDTIDGLHFYNTGFSVVVTDRQGQGKVLYASNIPERTYFRIDLPPGTTAAGLEQFSRPMEVWSSTGEKVTMTAGDGSDFVGFVSEAPVAYLIVTLDNPEPTPPVIIDNLTYGQRRAGNEPPKPLLLTSSPTGRAAAFDSVALTPEPFDVNTPSTRSLAADGRTRVTLLVAGLSLDAPGDESFVTARAVDSQQRVFDLPVESVGSAKNLSWVEQVTVLLPAGLAGAGDLSVSVTVRGVESNKAPLRVN